MTPVPERSVGEVVNIVIMGISLPLKRNVSVGQIGISVMQEANQVLGAIPEIKWEDEHFGLLPEVNALMNHQPPV